jgi:peptide/nickel transport system substrate-binding protein
MAKGDPIAEEVVYRFVPEVTTRMADLTAGQAHIITEVPHDQIATVAGQGNTGIEHAVVGSHWIRIATDVAPFDLPEVRQALNHAIDAEAIAQALVSPESHRLSSLFPDDRSLAFNPDLVPYTYDPDRARTLLDSVGVDSIDVEMEITSAARVDVAEAIAAQLGEVGINVSIVVSEYGACNANWVEPSAPALRLVTWGPLYEPQTLLGLVFHGSGYLSRYHNDEVDTLIDAGAAETDLEARRSIYAELTQVMYDDVPAVYLWNLAAGYGVAPLAAAWSSRGDEYVLPLHLGASSV